MILRRQVAAGHGGRHLGDVAHLRRQVAGHRVDAVGQVLPGARDSRHVGLAAEAAFGSDLARNARHLAGEAVELIHHGIECFLQLKDFAAHVHRDLARQVAAGDRGRDFGDVTDLAGEVRRHRVHGVRQIFPGAADTRHVGLAAELAFGTDLARHARHFGGERVELIDHGVERVFQLQDFAAHVDRDLARQVAARHGGGNFRDVTDLAGQIGSHRVDGVGQVLPGAGDTAHHGLTAELAFGADFARHAGHFAGEGIELVHHRVDGVFQFENFAADVHRNLIRQVAARRWPSTLRRCCGPGR